MAGVAKHVRGLDGLRAVAVMLVFLSHRAHADAVDVGQLGVWLFFLISGYLIIGELHRARQRIEADAVRRDAVLWVFFAKRALRILPLYYGLLVVLTLAHAAFWQHTKNLGFPWHFAFLSDYWIGIVLRSWPGPVSHFWSLAIEQQFYLVAPFVLLFTRADRHLRLCAAVVAVAALAHLALYQYGAVQPTIYAMSPWNFALIALGGTAAMAGGHLRLIGAAHRVPWLALGIAAAVACLLLRAAPRTPAPGALDIGIALSLYVVFLWIVSFPDSAVVQTLERAPVAYFGVISYGFYLFHNLVPESLGASGALYARLHLPVWFDAVVPLALQFAISALLAHLSWQLFEKRVLALKGPVEAAIRARLPLGGAPVRPPAPAETRS